MAQPVDDMKKPKEQIIEWIDHILERKKWTGTDLARSSGLAPSTILRLLNDPEHAFLPSLRTLQKIADGSGYPIPRTVTNVLSDAKAIEVEEDVETRRRSRVSTVELKHVSSLPSALQANIQPSRETYIPAPPQLDGDETAFAFYNPDSTFDPWMKAGSLMFATKRRDPQAGDIILLTDQGGKSRVRLLVDINEDGLKLSKSLPPKEDEALKFEDIKEIALVAIIFRI